MRTPAHRVRVRLYARTVRSQAARWVLRRKRQKPTAIAAFMVTK